MEDESCLPSHGPFQEDDVAAAADTPGQSHAEPSTSQHSQNWEASHDDTTDSHDLSNNATTDPPESESPSTSMASNDSLSEAVLNTHEQMQPPSATQDDPATELPLFLAGPQEDLTANPVQSLPVDLESISALPTQCPNDHQEHYEAQSSCPGNAPALPGQYPTTFQVNPEAEPIDQDIEIEDGNDSTNESNYINQRLSPLLQKELRQLQKRTERPYDPAIDDPKPRWQSYNPLFHAVGEACEDIVQSMNDLFQQAQCSSPSILKVGEHLKAHSKFQTPSPKTIGLLGDSGVGKSSLINSLLSTPGLALTDAGSRACTNNTIEYCYRFDNQTRPYAICIYFLEAKERRRMIRQHFRDYALHKQSDQDMDSNEFQLSFMRSQTAVETFQTLFRDRDEFADQTRIHEFLDSATMSSRDARLSKLLDWIEELLSEYDLVDDVLRLSAGTPAELSKVIEPFVKTPASASEDSIPPSPWPIVHRVKIGLDSALLGEGLIIADVPGISDTNRTRVTNAFRYLRQCEFLLVCGNIARIETNPEVLSQLTKAFRTHGSNKALIATKADLIGESNDAQARMAENETVAELRGELENVSQEHKTLTEQWKALRKQKRHGNSDLHGRLDDLAEYKALLEQVEKGRCMQVRSGRTSQGLQSIYNAATGDYEKLEVWCVSNAGYNAHLQVCSESSFPIPIEHTGIPALRLRLKHLTEHAKVQNMQFRFQHALPNLLTTAELWANPTGAERLEGLTSIVAKGIEACEKILERHSTDLTIACQTQLLRPIQTKLDTWTAQSLAISQPWTDNKKWKANTFYAFLRRDGKHKTPTKGYHDWNEMLLQPAVATLNPAWSDFEDTVSGTFVSCVETLKSLVDKIKEDLGHSHGGALISLHVFYEKLSRQKPILEMRVAEERRAFENKIK